MRIFLIGSIMLLSSTCVGIASPPATAITVVDEIGGASQASWTLGQDQTARIEVASRVGECTVQDFEIHRDPTHVQPPRAETVKPPDIVEGARAVLYLHAADGARVVVRYGRMVLVESGDGREPPQGPETSTSGSGVRVVGRALSEGYRFEHYEFSSTVSGPGGASAVVRDAPRRGSDQAFLKIHWYYDRYSTVTFSWKIYATGPCPLRP